MITAVAELARTIIITMKTAAPMLIFGILRELGADKTHQHITYVKTELLIEGLQSLPAKYVAEQINAGVRVFAVRSDARVALH